MTPVMWVLIGAAAVIVLFMLIRMTAPRPGFGRRRPWGRSWRRPYGRRPYWR